MNNDKSLTFEVVPQYIAYLDILGYEAKMKEFGGAEKLIQSIYSSIEQAKYIIRETTQKESIDNIRFRVFSDNIIFSSKENWQVLVAIAALTQANSARKGIFIRGTLCYDELCMDDEFVFGKGIISANKIEKEIVIFPRIILHQSFMNAVNNYGKRIEPNNIFELIGAATPNFVDMDEYCVLDYLSATSALLHPNKDIMIDFIKDHKNAIKSNLQRQSSDRVLQKFQWLKRYHNRYISETLKIEGVNLSEYLI